MRRHRATLNLNRTPEPGGRCWPVGGRKPLITVLAHHPRSHNERWAEKDQPQGVQEGQEGIKMLPFLPSCTSCPPCGPSPKGRRPVLSQGPATTGWSLTTAPGGWKGPVTSL